MNKSFSPEKILAANTVAVETMSTLSSLGLSTVERLVALNLNTVRAGLSDSAANLNALLAIKDPKALASFFAGLAEPAMANAVGYFRSAYAISTDGAEEFGKLVDRQLAEVNKSAAITLDQIAKSAPAGSDVAVAALKSAIAAANATYDNVTKVTKKVVQIAEANVTTTTGAAVKAVGKAAQKAA